jgi:DNA-binding transcriptional ArsR family regulator
MVGAGRGGSGGPESPGDPGGRPRRGDRAVPAGDTEVEAVFAGLSDATRRRLLDLLAARGGATATEAATELPVTRQALVKHLAVLGRAGLVRGERRGREVRYTVEPAALESTASWLTSLAAAWDARLAVIKRIAEEPE